MKSTFRLLFYLKRNGKKTNGAMPIIARLTINKQQVEFSTKLELSPTLWSVDQGRALGRSQEAQELNRLIDSIKARVYIIYYELCQRHSLVTAEMVKNDLLGLSHKEKTLLTLFQKHNEGVKVQIGKGKSQATYQKYEVTRKHLQYYIKKQYNLSDISLLDINDMFIRDFEVYLKTVGKCNANTTAKFMQFFKRIIIIARNNGWIRADPFANYKITLNRVEREYLSDDELNLLMSKRMPCQRLEQVRDIFLFACFTGLAYRDMCNLTKDNIVTEENGELWIKTERQKTKAPVALPLLPIAIQIIEKYKHLAQGNKVLLMLSCGRMNKNLKKIAAICGIEKRLIFHMGRHTYASEITLSQGVPIESVSRMLGHRDLRSTRVYAKITNDKIDEDMTTLQNRITNMFKFNE